VIEAADVTESLREGAWNQGLLFTTWHEYHRTLTSTEGDFPGWLRSPPPRNQAAAGLDDAGGIEDEEQDDVIAEADALAETEVGRGERVRLYSIDGISDPRNDMTPHDNEFSALCNLEDFPDTFQPRGEAASGQAAIEEELELQQAILFELEGQQPYPAGLPN
jgi:hypothetical protein